MEDRHNAVHRPGALHWTLLLLLVSTPPALAQESVGGESTQAVSASGLLPVYGVDFAFDPAWVDGAVFPGASSEFPHFGVNNDFQRLWESLRSSGFNTIRFPVKTEDAETEGRRLANLCLWAREHGVNLIPVLKSRQLGAPESDYPEASRSVVEALLGTLTADPSNHDAYLQVLAFQLEDAANHPGLHGAAAPERVRDELLQAARQIRSGEEERLRNSSLGSTPLMVSASLDSQLIRNGAIAQTALSEEEFSSAFSAVNDFLSPLAAAAEIDLIGVDWFAGSVSAGGVDRFPQLLQNLTAETGQKLILLTTGFSTAFQPATEQREFYRLAFANLADYRANSGMDSPFIGVLFHKAFSPAGQGADPPSPDLAARMAEWDWESKASELTRMWQGEASADLSWWWQQVQNGMGLLQADLSAGSVGEISAAAGQKSLEEIATSVSEASAEAAAESPAWTEPAGAPTLEPDAPAESGQGAGLGDTLQQVGQQYLLVVLDRLFGKLDGMLEGGSGADPGAYDPGTESDVMAASLTVRPEEVAIQPVEPQARQPISFNVTVHNESTEMSAAGLVVALVDELGALSYATDVTVGPAASQPVTLDWTPESDGTYQLWIQVYDEWLTAELAGVALDPLTVGSGDWAPSAGSNIAIAEQDLQIAPEQPVVGSPAKFTFSVQNESSQESASNLVVALVDDIQAVAYVTDVTVAPASAQPVSLEWTPTQSGSYQLWVQVYDEWLTSELASIELEPLNVGSGGGTSPQGPTDLVAGPEQPSGGPAFADAVLGLPKIELVKVLRPQIMTTKSMELDSSISATLSNPFSRPISNVVAKLMIDGQVSQKKLVRRLLPKQRRTLVFTGVSAGSADSDVQVVLETAGVRRLTASKAVSFAPPPPPAPSRGVRRVPGQQAAAGGPETSPALSPAGRAIRPVVPGSIRLGRLSIPTATASTAPPNPVKTAVQVRPRPTLRPSPAASTQNPTRQTRPDAQQSSTAPTRVVVPRPATVRPSQQPPSRTQPADPPPTIARVVLRPDLSVRADEITFTPSPPQPGKALLFSIRVRNLGPAPAQGARIQCQLTVNGRAVARREFATNIGARGASVLRWRVTAPARGAVAIQVNVEVAQDAVAGNNSATRAVSGVRLRAPQRVP